jgi:cytochrome c oxidase subunit IV
VKQISARTGVFTWLALLVLTGVSFALSFVHLGVLSVPVALFIATVKATLVATFFMELAIERFTVKVTLISGFFFVCLLISLMAGDVPTRPVPALLPPSPPV